MIIRTAIFLLAGVVALLSDGASLGIIAPPSPVVSHPPISFEDLREDRPSGIGHLNSRGALGATARIFVERPNDSRIAARLLDLARSSGREDWLRSFARAVARRMPTPSALFLLAELDVRNSGHLAAIGLIRRAHRASPQDPEIAVSYAAALAGTGKPMEAYAVLAPATAEPLAWASYSFTALQRLSVMVAAVAPEGLGDRLTAVWLRRSWRADHHSARAMALAFSSTLAAGVGRDEASLAMASASMDGTARLADAEAITIALMNSAEVTSDTRLVRRFEGACGLIPETNRVARADCLVSALQHAVFTGSFRRALGLYSLLEEHAPSNPLLTVRLSAAALPLLEMSGEYRESVDVASKAVIAAGSMGDRDLEGSFLALLARARRLTGDFPGAREAAERAGVVANGQGAAARRAVFEQAAVERAASRFPAATDFVATDSPEGDRLPMPPVVWSYAEATRDVRQSGIQWLLHEVAAALELETEHRRDEALTIYLEAIGYVRSIQASNAPDLLESATLSDVWQHLTRRALSLALSSGRAELGLAVLESARTWGTSGEWNQRPVEDLAIPHDSAVVAYAVGPTRVWAIVLRGRETHVLDIPAAPSHLRDQVILWRELAKSNASAATWRALGESLAGSLLATLETSGLMDGVNHVFFVPDDILHLIPFSTLAALRGGDAINYNISQFPSLASVKRRRVLPASGAPIVAFGVGGGGDILDEMRIIRGLGGRAFIGPRATEAEWKRQSAGASVIHFSGHAAPLDEAKWASALRLTADSGNDGLLTIAEILSIPINGAVVVLLGCDTAARPDEPGPSVYYRQVPSLGEAFLDAGARAVVGNLWAITEEDARLMAEAFYGAGGPARGAAALEEARATLKMRFPDMPRRWAGAVWLGEFGPMLSTAEFRDR